VAEIERRRQLYGVTGLPARIEERPVIVVDDGIATGGTVKAALLGLKPSHPGSLILAVPVAPADSLEQLREACDEVVCLLTPSPFHAVGEHYADFTQTTDEEVLRLLALARKRPG
jgi:putative phosphoribosyl transferase